MTTIDINNINFNGKTILHLNNGATISAEGKKSNRKCKPILCIERGKVYTSIYDAATDNGVNPQYLSKLLINNDGYLKRKNLHFKYLTDRDDGLDAMTSHMQKLSENYEELIAKAKAWDALMAEKEAERKAEEKRQNAIAHTKERIEKHEAKADELLAKHQKEIELVASLKEELAQLEAETI